MNGSLTVSSMSGMNEAYLPLWVNGSSNVFVTERCVVQTPQVELVICLVKKADISTRILSVSEGLKGVCLIKKNEKERTRSILRTILS